MYDNLSVTLGPEFAADANHVTLSFGSRGEPFAVGLYKGSAAAFKSSSAYTSMLARVALTHTQPEIDSMTAFHDISPNVIIRPTLTGGTFVGPVEHARRNENVVCTPDYPTAKAPGSVTTTLLKKYFGGSLSVVGTWTRKTSSILPTSAEVTADPTVLAGLTSSQVSALLGTTAVKLTDASRLALRPWLGLGVTFVSIRPAASASRACFTDIPSAQTQTSLFAVKGDYGIVGVELWPSGSTYRASVFLGVSDVSSSNVPLTTGKTSFATAFNPAGTNSIVKAGIVGSIGGSNVYLINKQPYFSWCPWNGNILQNTAGVVEAVESPITTLYSTLGTSDIYSTLWHQPASVSSTLTMVSRANGSHLCSVEGGAATITDARHIYLGSANMYVSMTAAKVADLLESAASMDATKAANLASSIDKLRETDAILQLSIPAAPVDMSAANLAIGATKFYQEAVAAGISILDEMMDTETLKTKRNRVAGLIALKAFGYFSTSEQDVVASVLAHLPRASELTVEISAVGGYHGTLLEPGGIVVLGELPTPQDVALFLANGSAALFLDGDQAGLDAALVADSMSVTSSTVSVGDYELNPSVLCGNQPLRPEVSTPHDATVRAMFMVASQVTAPIELLALASTQGLHVRL